MEIFHGHKYHFNVDDVDYSLVIHKVKLEDGGKYTLQCNDITTSAWLYVEGKSWTIFGNLEKYYLLYFANFASFPWYHSSL